MSHQEALPPHNVGAEAGVLGSLLIDPEAISQIADALQPADFYEEAHRMIYQVVLALHAADKPTDLLTLCDELALRGQLEEVGGAAYVGSLANHVPTSRNVKHYAQIVERTGVQRRVIDAAAQISAAAYVGNHADIAGMLTWAEVLLREAREGNRASRKAPYHLLSIQEVLAQPRPEGLIEGYYSLNSTGLTYAAPGVGKTVLLLDQMAHVALGQAWEGHAVKGGHVVYVCAEGQAFLAERLQALMLKLGVTDIPRLHILPARVQLLQAHTVPRLVQTFAGELPQMPVWVAFDTVSQTSDGADENDAGQMGAYLGAMDRLRETTGAFVHAIHHSGKDESRGARGSSVLRGNCDTVTCLTMVGDTTVWKCEKQRGGWAPFKPFSFKVMSRALDDDAEWTGPYIEACDASKEAAAVQPMPTGQVKRAYTIFQELAQQRGGGVEYAVWERACEAVGIPESTFKHALRRLASEFGLIVKSDGAGRWYPAGEHGTAGGDEGGRDGEGEGEGPKGQQEDNGPELSQPHSGGQSGPLFLEGLALLAPVGERRPVGDVDGAGPVVVCPACGEADLMRDGDGQLRCRKCLEWIA